MDFKEWLMDEARFKGLQRIFKNNNPSMPRYVQNDLYNARVKKTMGLLQKSNYLSSSGSAKELTADHQNAQWSRKPEILMGKSGQGVTPADFTRRTQEYFLHRMFGFKEIAAIPNDAQRTEKQKELMASRESNEPIIVNHTIHGFDLVEGWHRTMNYLLRGAPKDQLDMLRNQQIDNINFSKWFPVKLQGYIARSPEVLRATAGTGDFTPSQPLKPSQFSQPLRQPQA